MTQTEALKLALEALETFHYAMIDAGVLDRQEVLNQGFTVATAIKEALAQPDENRSALSLYESGFIDGKEKGLKEAQRTWVGLTDDEFEDIELGCRSTPFGKIEAMRMVEAKLKDKNI